MSASQKVFVARAVEDKRWYVWFSRKDVTSAIDGPFRSKKAAMEAQAYWAIVHTPTNLTPMTPMTTKEPSR